MKPIYILSHAKVPGAKSLPLIQHTYLHPRIDITSYDYLIFTSKTAVFALDTMEYSWKQIPALAIGNATAKAIKERGGRVAFIAKSFYGEDFAKDIATQFSKKKRFLYLRAKVVSTDIAKLLRDEGMRVDQAIIYTTSCAECTSIQPPPQGAVILFSSPSTVRCFFRCFSWDTSYKAVAIGKKTAATFPQNIQVHVFEQKTLAQIVDFIRNKRFHLL